MSGILSLLAGLLTAVSPESGPVFKEIPTGAPRGNYAAVVMGDFDGDGRAEIVSGRRADEEGLFLFTYRDSRWTKRQLTKRGEYGGIDIADVTGDGVPDVVAVKTGGDRSDRGVEFFKAVRNKGTVQFVAQPSPFSAASCDDIATGDIEGDGDIDIAVSAGGGGVKILLNDGGGRSFRTLTLKTGNYEDTGIALGDFNGDQRLDCITTNHPGNPPRAFLCSASGEVAYDEGHTDNLHISKNIGYGILVTKLDGDAFTDLAIGTVSGLLIFRGNGCKGARSTWWREMSLRDRCFQTMQVQAGDLDADRRADLVFTTGEGLAVLLNRGASGFSGRIQCGLPERGEFSGCHLFDWDGDGDLDVACSSLQGNGVRFFENRSTQSSNSE